MSDLALPCCEPSASSGAMYIGEPIIMPARVMLSSSVRR